MKVVVDANIVFSALLRAENRYAEVLLTEGGDDFFTPRFVMVEIFKHKEKILRHTKCAQANFLNSKTLQMERVKCIYSWLQ